jgi:hypothetical protein
LQLFKEEWITFEDISNINSNPLPNHASSSERVNIVEFGKKTQKVLRVTIDKLYDM